MTNRERLPNRRYNPKTIDATLRLLSERWPCFVLYERKRRPLALLIDQQIAAAMAGVITPDDLTAALRHYTGNVHYLRSCVESATRIGLAGEPAGVVTEAEATYAAKVLARRQSKAKAKAAAAAAAVAAAQPKRISLADLKAAALQRRMEAASA